MNSNFENAKNILIIRLSSLGDILLTVPVLNALKKKYPEKNFFFVANKNFFDAIKFNPALSGIFEYEKSNPAEAIEKLKSAEIDFIVDLQNNRRSKQIIGELKLPAVRYKKPNLKKFLLVNFKIDLFDEIKSVPQMYAESIGAELQPTFEDFEFYLPEGKTRWKADKRKICVCPGAQHFTKRYPAEYHVEFARKLIAEGFEVVLLGGKSDKEICAEIASKAPGVKDKSNDNDLFALAREMETCAVAVCNDSGLMHLASSVGVPVIAVFGSSVRQFGFAPFSPKSLLLENNSLSCRPCSHIGRKNCPKKHFKCMLELKPDYLYNEFLKFYGEYV